MVLWTVARCVLQSLSRTVWVSFQHLLGYQNLACLELALSSLCIDPVVVSLFHWVCCASLLVRWCTVPLWNKLMVTRMRTASEARENDRDTSTLTAGNYQRVLVSLSFFGLLMLFASSLPLVYCIVERYTNVQANLHNTPSEREKQQQGQCTRKIA